MIVVMRYQHAVVKLRDLARACEAAKNWPPGDPLLLEAYVFGDLLAGVDPLECVEVALVVNLPPQEVPWGSTPPGLVWLADRLGVSKGNYLFWWRSRMSPVWNHHIQGPVRFWSLYGADTAVLDALAQRRLGELPRQQPTPAVYRQQLAAELEIALNHLRSVYTAYWDSDWRRRHRGFARYPEHELWDAVDGYLELRDAADPPASSEPGLG